MKTLWKGRQFEQLVSYVDNLNEEHPRYVPAMCAKLTIQEYSGKPIEKAHVRETLDQLVVSSKALPAHFPPRFIGILQSAIREQERLTRLNKRASITEAASAWSRSFRRIDADYALKFWTLIQIAPRISLPEAGSNTVLEFAPPALNEIDPQLTTLTIDALVEIANDIDTTFIEREALILRIAAAKPADSFPVLLEQIEDSALCSLDAALAICTYSDMALPVLVDMLENNRVARVAKNGIYALMRLDRNTPEVREVLQRHIDDGSAAAAYAQVALDYLGRQR